jgi:hypothetical protein
MTTNEYQSWRVTMRLILVAGIIAGLSLPAHAQPKQTDDFSASLPSFDATSNPPLPAEFSGGGGPRRPEDARPTPFPDTDATWADVGHATLAGLHEALAATAGFIASTESRESGRLDWQYRTLEEQAAAKAQREQITPGVEERGWSHPLVWAAEQPPFVLLLSVLLGCIVVLFRRAARRRASQGPHLFDAQCWCRDCVMERHLRGCITVTPEGE